MSVFALACMPDGGTLASGSADKTVRLWRLSDGTCTAVLEGHTQSVYALACTPDGATLASGSRDNTVRLWRLSDGTCTAVLEGHTSFVVALACTPDGATLASGSVDNTVRLWRLADNTCTIVIKYSYMIYALAYTPRGSSLIIARNSSVRCISKMAIRQAVLGVGGVLSTLFCTLAAQSTTGLLDLADDLVVAIQYQLETNMAPITFNEKVLV